MTHSQTGGFNRRSFLSAFAAAPAAMVLTGIAGVPAHAAAASAPVSRFADFQRRHIGGIEVIAIADGYGALPSEVVVGITEDAARIATKAAHKTYDPKMVSVAVNTYVIRTGDRVIAVDSGAPGAMAPSVGAWQESLRLAGVAPEDVDTLFLTHSHLDHVGGMTDGDGARVLPNAQLVLSGKEWTFLHDDAVFNAIPEQLQAQFTVSRRQAAAYGEGRREIDMSGETEIAPGVTATPLPGHTPGHMGLRIADGNDAMVIWGDIVHVPALQFAHPDWGVVFDADLDQAKRTRARMFDMASADDLLVAGMHLDFPGFGYVERETSGFGYINAPQDYRV